MNERGAGQDPSRVAWRNRDVVLIPAEVAAGFFAASVVLALAPGPDNLFVLAHSALYGPAAGLVITCGLCTGLVVHTSAVALGVAALVQASDLAFTALKLLGAGYLLYLAWSALRSSARRISPNAERRARPVALYGRGIVMNITNPKVTIFFLAFLPQFADPGRGRLTLQLLSLGALFIAATLLVFGGIALLAGTVGRWLAQSERMQRVMNAIAAAVFVALALKLLTSAR